MQCTCSLYIARASPQPLRLCRASEPQSSRRSTQAFGPWRSRLSARGPSASLSACARSSSGGSCGAGHRLVSPSASGSRDASGSVWPPATATGSLCSGSMPRHEAAQSVAINAGLLAHSPPAAHVAQEGFLSLFPSAAASGCALTSAGSEDAAFDLAAVARSTGGGLSMTAAGAFSGCAAERSMTPAANVPSTAANTAAAIYNRLESLALAAMACSFLCLAILCARNDTFYRSQHGAEPESRRK